MTKPKITEGAPTTETQYRVFTTSPSGEVSGFGGYFLDPEMAEVESRLAYVWVSPETKVEIRSRQITYSDWEPLP